MVAQPCASHRRHLLKYLLKATVAFVVLTILMTVVWDMMFPGRVYYCTDHVGFDYLHPGDWVHGEVEIVDEMTGAFSRSMSDLQIYKKYMNNRNLFFYWTGSNYSLLNILKSLILLHSTNGIGYKPHFINDDNINNYIKSFPNNFNSLNPAHKADYIRVELLYEYGGIWLDSDTLVMDSLDSLFDILDKYDGFFIKENNQVLCNGVFGSNPKTQSLYEWRNIINEFLNNSNHISWTSIGSDILKKIDTSKYFIFNGLDNLYPVNWNNCVREFISKEYDNYKNIVREYQPLIVLVNSVYKALENIDERNIINSKIPLLYFIKKSFNNLKCIDYDFIEIGTSDFDTLIENSKSEYGISVDMIKYYIDKLPNKENVLKYNVGISDHDTELDSYYIPEDIIIKNNLPMWFKGCNSIDKYHPLHIKYKVEHLCVIEKFKVISVDKLFYENKVRSVRLLKIDTEGHEYVILKKLFTYLKTLPIIFYPIEIIFETNENSAKCEIDELINLYKSIGYTLISRGYDTILKL